MADPEPQTKAARIAASLAVGWFRNDLRINDNPMLEELMEKAKTHRLPAILVYIFDPRFFDKVSYGRVTDMTYTLSIPTRRGGKEHLDFSSRKCNGRRARFYLNVLRDLKRGLAELGTELWAFYGKAEDVFAKLSNQYGAVDVVCLQEPVSPEWTDVEGLVDVELKKNGGSLTTLWGAMSFFHEEDLPFALKESPWNYSALSWELGWEDVWTSGKQREGAKPIRQPISAPSGPWPLQKVSAPPFGAWTDAMFDDDRSALAQLGYSEEEIETTLKAPHGGSRKGKGGETAAWARLKAWMDKEGEKEKKNPKFKGLGGGFGAGGALYLEEGEVDPFQWKNLSQPNGWLQLSKYLACGCISPRQIYHTLLEKEHWALPGVVHRLMWREWHRFNAIKFHRRLFWLQGPGRQNTVWKTDNEAAERWKNGMTGIPYVDAVLRELKQTGWISYAGRKTVACFLVHDLWIDWRLGAFHFEEMLLDYDVAMNYGNWIFCARVDKDYDGTNWRSPGHEDIVDNILSIASNDPEGTYVRQWVPELRAVPNEYLHSPWTMPSTEMETAGCVIGKDYPEPLVKLNMQQEWATSATEAEAGGSLEAQEDAQAAPDTPKTTEIKKLRRENAELKDEVQKLNFQLAARDNTMEPVQQMS